MCPTIPPPPPGVNTAAVDQPTAMPMTKRQRLEMHRSAAACAGCHGLMDPLGLPLESFDAIGKYRTTDNGLPVDPTSTSTAQPVADARGLGVAASQSVAVAQCLVRKYYALRRGPRGAGRGRERPQHPGDGVQGIRFQVARPDPRRRDERRVSRPSPRNPNRTVDPMPNKTLDRRTVLKGMLATGADGEHPAAAAGDHAERQRDGLAQTATPVSPLFVTVVLRQRLAAGHMEAGQDGTGTNWDLSAQLQPLSALKSYLTVISGLTNKLVVGGARAPDGLRRARRPARR